MVTNDFQAEIAIPLRRKLGEIVKGFENGNEDELIEQARRLLNNRVPDNFGWTRENIHMYALSMADAETVVQFNSVMNQTLQKAGERKLIPIVSAAELAEDPVLRRKQQKRYYRVLSLIQGYTADEVVVTAPLRVDELELQSNDQFMRQQNFTKEEVKSALKRANPVKYA
ncbi:MAG: hypothetical protein M3Q44_05915 [bacterium]|nr:hypothetical protein [bacterium]